MLATRLNLIASCCQLSRINSYRLCSPFDSRERLRSSKESRDDLLYPILGFQNAAHVEVCAEADVAGFARGGEHAFTGEGLQEFGRVVDGDEDEIGLWLLGLVAGLSQSRGQVAGVVRDPRRACLRGSRRRRVLRRR